MRYESPHEKVMVRDGCSALDFGMRSVGGSTCLAFFLISSSRRCFLLCIWCVSGARG